MQVDFTFQEYLGFLAFLGIATMGFWLMIFLLSYVVPYWVFGAAIERFKESRAAKKTAKTRASCLKYLYCKSLLLQGSLLCKGFRVSILNHL